MQSKNCGKMPKRGQNESRKIAVQHSAGITEIDPVFWKLSQNWKEMRKQMRQRYLSKKSLTYEIYAGTSKAADKVFQQRDASSIRSFPFFITCSSLHRNCD